MREPELLPCPFCSSPTPQVHAHERGFYVTCYRKGCGVDVQMDCETEEQAVERWNSRAAAPPGDAEVERKRVLELIERFQRDPQRSQPVINAFEWLRRQIEEGNHTYHKFEEAPAISARYNPDICYRCDLHRAALIHAWWFASSSPVPTTADGPAEPLQTLYEMFEDWRASFPVGHQPEPGSPETERLIDAWIAGFAKHNEITCVAASSRAREDGPSNPARLAAEEICSTFSLRMPARAGDRERAIVIDYIAGIITKHCGGSE